jgi:phage tail-like protein
MDANGSRGWAARAPDFDRLGVALRGAALVLESRRATAPIVEDLAVAALQRGRAPAARVDWGSVATADAHRVRVRTAAGEEQVPWEGTPGEDITDVAITGDGVLTIAAGPHVHLVDLRNPEARATLTPAFPPWRLAARPDGAWIAGEAGQLVRWTGRLRLPAPPSTPVPGQFRPEVERPDAPRLVPVHLTTDADAVTADGDGLTPLTLSGGALTLPPGATVACVAASPGGALAVGVWLGDGVVPDAPNAAGLVRISPKLGAAWVRLNDLRRPFSARWLDDDRLALLAAMISPDTVPEALVVDLSDPALLRDGADLSGDVYPLPKHDGGPLLHTTTGPPHYPTAPPPGDGAPPATRPVVRLSRPERRRRAAAFLRHPFDAGVDAAPWHRLALELDLPPGCGVLVDVVANDDPQRPAAWIAEALAHDGADPDDDFTAPFPAAHTIIHPHALGELGPTEHVSRAPAAPLDPPSALVTAPRALPAHTPRLVWTPEPSEVALFPGLLGCAPEPDRRGVFQVLLQRAGRATRTLRGRFLHVRVELHGDGRASPGVVGLRAWGDRTSYVQRYLPELYHETLSGPDADAGAPLAGHEVPATPADFHERFVHLFESVLTPMEDKVAAAWQLTDPRTAPADALPWLAGWVGLALQPDHDDATRRRMLQAAPLLARAKGTAPGLRLGLDALTAGGVERGEVVVLESWRLRRTWATLLGIDNAAPDHPLLPGGLARGTHSFLGDSLLLGEPPADGRLHAGMLALLPAAARSAAQSRDVRRFWAELAWRVMVLVHDGLSADVVARVEREAARVCPAHVRLTVHPVDQAFLVGVRALVGVQTRFGPRPALKPVRLDKTVLGEGDHLLRPPALDPGFEGGPA